jgi:hypothetical protein
LWRQGSGERVRWEIDGQRLMGQAGSEGELFQAPIRVCWWERIDVEFLGLSNWS